MEAIVLSRRDFREHDQIVSVYTKEKGKLELLARGMKKITSKQAAHCEPFSYNMIEVAVGREIDHLIKVVPIDVFPNTRKDFQKSVAAGYIMSVVDRLVQVGEPDTQIWQLLLGWLKFIEKTSITDLVLLVDGYMITFLQYLGFTPILDRCVVSGKTYQDLVREELAQPKSMKPGLYFAGGGLVSPEVRMEKEKAGEEIASCGLRDISNLQLLLTGNWQQIAETTLSTEEKTALHGLVLQFAQYHSERGVRDVSKIVQSV